jgi:hypothetical protein
MQKFIQVLDLQQRITAEMVLNNPFDHLYVSIFQGQLTQESISGNST